MAKDTKKQQAETKKAPQRVSMAKQTCNLKKEFKRHIALLYKGSMHKDILREFGGPDKERTMMLHDVKKPGGYQGI